MLTWLRTILSRKASATASATMLSHVGQPVWTPRRYDRLAEEGYNRNSVAFRAISIVARAAAAVPWQIFRGEQELGADHPAVRLLAQPNPQQGGAQLVEALVAYYLLSGNLYMEGVGPAGGAPRELYALRPDRMTVIAGRAGIAAYRYEVNGVPVIFPVDLLGRSQILHLKSFHPTDDFYGMSPIEAAAYAVDAHNSAAAWNVAMMQNACRPSGALVYAPKGDAGATLTAPQRDAIRREVTDAYAGPANAARPMVLEGALQWQEMGLAPKDMEWLEGRRDAAREIAQVFGVPAQLLGIPGDNTYANMHEARLALYEDTVFPLLRSLTQAVANWLAPWFGPLAVRLDEEAVPAVQEKRRALWQSLSGADFLTPNEKREALGYAPRPEAEADRLWIASGLAPLDGGLGETLTDEPA